MSKEILQFLNGNIILHQLGDHGFQLINIPHLPDISTQHGQILSLFFCNFTQHQAFSCLFHNCILNAKFIKNTVRQTFKTDYINIDNDMIL